jgi:hypothetical protein
MKFKRNMLATYQVCYIETQMYVHLTYRADVPKVHVACSCNMDIKDLSTLLMFQKHQNLQ